MPTVNRPLAEPGACQECAGREPDHTLNERALRLLSTLGKLVIDDIKEQHQREELRIAIANVLESGELEIAYQPVFALGEDRCLGLEALARFPEPLGAPDQTFAAAEQIGLGVELERAAMRRAWAILPRLAPGQFLSLNSSPAALLAMARGEGGAGDVPWPSIVVEVTEHSAIDAYAALQHELAPLRERGLRIAVDDVGAGYASLRHVLELRPDFIKLDRWLIDGVAEDFGKRAVVSAFVALARELGATVIGEGVERREDLGALRELGLDAAQGYLLGGPTSDRDAVLGWCADRAPTLWDGARHSPTSPSPELPAVLAQNMAMPPRLAGDSLMFLEDAVDELLRLTWLYRELLHAEEPIAVQERRRIMGEAEERAGLDELCERIPLAFACLAALRQCGDAHSTST